MVPRVETLGAVFRPASLRAGWEFVAAGVVRAALWLLLPALILQVFDRSVPAARAGDLLPLAIAVVVALAVRSILDLATELMADSLRRVRDRTADWLAIQALLGRGLPYQENGRDVSLGDAGLRLHFLCRMSGLPVLLAALIYLGGVMAMPAVMLSLLAGLTAWIGHRRPADNGLEYSGMTDARPLVPGILEAVWTIKAMGAEQLVLRLAEDDHRQHVGTGEKTASRRMVSASRFAAVFDGMTVILSVLLGCILALNELVTLGQFVAGVVISVLCVRDAYWGTAGWTASRADNSASPESFADGATEIPQEPLPRITGNLMVNRVSLEEPANGMRAVSRTLFDRIRIEVEAGETVLVKGGDVHMQSALLRLMAGLERPASGTVTVDGYDLADFRPDSIRRQIAYVPTLCDVIPGTVMENLTGFDSGRIADAMGAARLTGLDGKAACLSDGFDTRLENGAPGFPIGFLQHLAVTRALAFKPRVLLLDYATENLDSQDLRAFSDVLERLKGRVTIIITSTQAGLRAMTDREIDLDSLTPAPEIGSALEPETETGQPDDSSGSADSEDGQSKDGEG